MTYARWRQDGFDERFVVSSLGGDVSPLPTGGLRFSGDAILGDPLILLETGVEFLVPISDADRSRIIHSALQSALKDNNYGPPILIREINKATHKFVRSLEDGYVMVNGLSFRHFEDISRVQGPGCRLYVRQQLPPYVSDARSEAQRRSREAVRGAYPDEPPFNQYAPTWIHVRGRSVFEAMDRAVEALDLRRGIWNYALNRGVHRIFPTPNRGPVNEVLADPLYSLHRRDGSLATKYDWVGPEYVKPGLSKKVPQKWDRIRADEEGIRAVLRRSPYRPMLEDVLRKYCRALDSVDLSRAFLEL